MGPILQHDPASAWPLDRDFPNGRVLVDGSPRLFGRNPQSLGDLTVLNLMVLWAPDCARELAGEMWLPASGFGRRDPLQWQAELLLERELMVQPRLIVGRRRHDQRAFGTQ